MNKLTLIIVLLLTACAGHRTTPVKPTVEGKRVINFYCTEFSALSPKGEETLTGAAICSRTYDTCEDIRKQAREIMEEEGGECYEAGWRIVDRCTPYTTAACYEHIMGPEPFRVQELCWADMALCEKGRNTVMTEYGEKESAHSQCEQR